MDHIVKVSSRLFMRHGPDIFPIIAQEFRQQKTSKAISEFFLQVLIEIEMSERLDKKSAETENKSLAADGPGIVMRRNIMR